MYLSAPVNLLLADVEDVLALSHPRSRLFGSSHTSTPATIQPLCHRALSSGWYVHLLSLEAETGDWLSICLISIPSDDSYILPPSQAHRIMVRHLTVILQLLYKLALRSLVDGSMHCSRAITSKQTISESQWWLNEEHRRGM